MPKKKMYHVNWEMIDEKIKEENITMGELSKLIGKAETYYSKMRRKDNGLPKDSILSIAELLEISPRELTYRDTEEEAKKIADKATKEVSVQFLIQEIGELRGRIVQLEKKIEEPAIVAIPMDAKEMAIRVMEELLEGGWCTKDDVLVAFNKHHIPTQYIVDAVHANGVVLATSGVADHARTFYIKEG